MKSITNQTRLKQECKTHANIASTATPHTHANTTHVQLAKEVCLTNSTHESSSFKLLGNIFDWACFFFLFWSGIQTGRFIVIIHTFSQYSARLVFNSRFDFGPGCTPGYFEKTLDFPVWFFIDEYNYMSSSGGISWSKKGEP